MSLGDKSAFPDFVGADGMTYRMWLAGLAMQSIIGIYPEYELVSELSIKHADALIAELEKSNGNA